MNTPGIQQITGILLSLTFILVTVQLIRKHKLREEYALVWLGTFIVIFTLSVVGWIVSFLADFFLVVYAPTIVLVFGLLFVLVILLTQSVVLSSQANHIRDLAQNAALLEWRLRQLENESELDTFIIGEIES